MSSFVLLRRSEEQRAQWLQRYTFVPRLFAIPSVPQPWIQSQLLIATLSRIALPSCSSQKALSWWSLVGARWLWHWSAVRRAQWRHHASHCRLFLQGSNFLLNLVPPLASDLVYHLKSSVQYEKWLIFLQKILFRWRQTSRNSHILAVSDEDGYVSFFDTRRSLPSYASCRESTGLCNSIFLIFSTLEKRARF